MIFFAQPYEEEQSYAEGENIRCGNRRPNAAGLSSKSSTSRRKAGGACKINLCVMIFFAQPYEEEQSYAEGKNIRCGN